MQISVLDKSNQSDSYKRTHERSKFFFEVDKSLFVNNVFTDSERSLDLFSKHGCFVSPTYRLHPDSMSLACLYYFFSTCFFGFVGDKPHDYRVSCCG